MKVYTKLIDHRLTQRATVDLIAKQSTSVITVIYYANWQKAVYLLGRRVLKS